MDGESLEQIEHQLAGVQVYGAPSELRVTVLADVGRELRAARWDRRLARSAVVLSVFGVGLNVVTGMWAAALHDSMPPQVVQSEPRPSLIDTAIVVAEATDATTGGQFVRQLAVMSGRALTADEVAEIDAAVRGITRGNRG
jgi:hypothetical protein